MIKNTFQIQDLENLSGIKAHTIRIWEKRYAILNPDRINRNVRIYRLEDLQKLLNIAVLIENGFKISKAAALSQNILEESVKKVRLNEAHNNAYVTDLLVIMYSFDVEGFERIYKELIGKYSFKDVFVKVFIPLLQKIGVLWQTNAIKPVQEHFISNLILEKLTLQNAQLSEPVPRKEVSVLFVPEGEMHSIGLLFVNYCLRLSGVKTIFLGGSIPTLNLPYLQETYAKIHWITSFVIDRTDEEKRAFLTAFQQLISTREDTFTIIGSMWGQYKEDLTFANITFYEAFAPFLEKI